MLTNFLYFNLSDLVNQTDSTNFFKHDMFEDYEHLDRFGGFFFNIKNITKNEIENFLIFYSVDIKMLEDSFFVGRLCYFFSLFYNQALILYFMKLVTIAELYMVFSNKYVSKMGIGIMLDLFNKRILLEVYRFFLTFYAVYSKLGFMDFKNFILSSAYFFDSDKFLYHYYYFISYESVGFDFFYRYYSNFLDDVFMNRVSFLNILEYLCDSLIFNLYNNMANAVNFSITRDVVFNEFKFLSFRFLGKRQLKSLKHFKYVTFLRDLNLFFSIFHEFFAFFRFYLYLFYRLFLKKGSVRINYKFFRLFVCQYYSLIEYYNVYDFFGFFDLKIIFFQIFFEIKLILYKLIFLNSRVYFFALFLNFNYFFLKFFNMSKFFFLKNIINLSKVSITFKYNSFLFNIFLKNLSPNMSLSFCDVLFDFNILQAREGLMKKSFFYKVLKNLNFSFNVKKLFFLFYMKDLCFLNISGSGQFQWLFPFFTLRTICNFQNIKSIYHVTSFTVFYNKFLVKYNNVVSVMSVVGLYLTLLQFFSNYKNNFYMPFIFRIKGEIEDFFFLLNEESFVEDFNYFLDDILFFDKEESESNDAEDDDDFLDNFTDDVSPDDLYFYLFLEDIISVNYYVYDVYAYKYDDMYGVNLKQQHFGVSLIYDFEYSKLAPFFSKQVFLYGGDDLVDQMNGLGWYNWVCYALFSDLTSFDINFFNRISDVRPFKNGVLNYIFFGNSGEMEDSDHLNDVFKLDTTEDEHLLNLELTSSDLVYNSDENLLKIYGSFNEFYNSIIYNTYEDPETRLNEPFVRDLVVLNDTWIWWDYMGRVLKRSKRGNGLELFKTKIKPSNNVELLFFSTYILSGLSFVVQSVLGRSTDEEKGSRYDTIALAINDLYEMNIVKDELYEFDNVDKYKNYRQYMQTFDFYYVNWFNSYVNMVFLYDYSDFVDDVLLYDYTMRDVDEKDFNDSYLLYNEDIDSNDIQRLPRLTGDSFVFLQKIEKLFFFNLMETFKMSLLAFYSYKLKKRSVIFWEHFFLNVIEVSYSFVDFDFMQNLPTGLTDMYFNEDVDMQRFKLPKIIDFLYSDSSAGESELSNDYLNLYLQEINNPYTLLFNGLSTSVSSAEMLFFDLYESYMEIYTDTDQDDFNTNSIMNFKFFEYDDAEIRYNDLEVTKDIQNELIDDYSPFGFEYADERNAHESMQMANYYIGEGYDFYLLRYYSIYKYNFFLYGLFSTFLQKYSGILSTFNVKQDSCAYNGERYYLLHDLRFFNLELIYYYLILFFFTFLRKINLVFNVFILYLFYFYFILLIKRLCFSLSYQSLFLLFFTGYYFYSYVNVLKNEFNMTYVDFNGFNVVQLYGFLKSFLRKLAFMFFLFIKSYNFFFFRFLFYKKYYLLIFYLFKNKSYKSFYVYMSKFNKNVKSMTSSDFGKQFGALFNGVDSTFRSSISLLPLYMQYNNKMHLLDKTEIIGYLYNVPHLKNILPSVNFARRSVVSNYNNNYFLNFLDGELNKSANSLSVDHKFLDIYDSMKEVHYYDYEDVLDDEEFFTDEWTGELPYGDISDDYEEDTGAYLDELDYNKEELNFEFDLDPIFLHVVHDVEGYNNYYKYQNHLFEWSNKYLYFFNSLYYYNLLLIRTFFIKLLKYYKIRVPMLTSVGLHENFAYSDLSVNYEQPVVDLPYDSPYKIYNEFAFSPSRYNYSTYANKRKSMFTKLKRLSSFKMFKHEVGLMSNFEAIIPKYIYTFDLIDILDYFIDFNNVEIMEFDEPYDKFNVLAGFNLDGPYVNHDSLYLNNFFLKLMRFYRYVYLYIYVFQYLDAESLNKILLYAFFFFDLVVYFNKFCSLIKLRCGKVVDVNYVYVFNKSYVFLYDQLKFFLNTRDCNLDVFYNFNFLTFRFVPFYTFNYKLLLKKVMVLKAFYVNFLSLSSYFFFVKALDFLKFSGLSKADFVLFFFKIKKYLKFYEFFIFKNYYRLVQIYVKYGLADAVFFFEKAVIVSLFVDHKEYYIRNYKLAYHVIFIWEMFCFCCICILLVLFLVQVNFNIFLGHSFWPKFYKEREEGFHVMIINYSRHVFENKLSYLINKTWLDLWGIF